MIVSYERIKLNFVVQVSDYEEMLKGEVIQLNRDSVSTIRIMFSQELIDRLKK